MHKHLTILLATLLAAGLAFAQDTPVHPDLIAEDQALVLAVTAPTTDFTKSEQFELLPGGAATTKELVSRDIFSLSSANLSLAEEERFRLGNALFRTLWVSSPSPTLASDGLGPLFNARGCQDCHLKDGRGRPPEPGQEAVSMFLRLSVPAADADQQALLDSRAVLHLPEPAYGEQLQTFAVPGLKAEGKMEIAYGNVTKTFADGTVVNLRSPVYSVTDLAYGEMSDAVMMSPRVAPPMIGLGLLEAIPAEDILSRVDPDDKDGDGISGRANMVRDPATGTIMLGRFGWKSGAATIRAQSAGAFAGDIGISTELLNRPHGDCTPVQSTCLASPTGEQAARGVSEAPEPVLDLVNFYSQNLAVPQRRDIDKPEVLRGKALFYGAQCTSCHTPKFVTSRDAPTEGHRFQLIWPYSDMLLHNMGEGLSDGRPEGDADIYEWRTQPLWGIGLTETVSGHTLFLHDGRARNLTEAILWHGGEAEKSRDTFMRMTQSERNDLLAFLKSL